MYTIYADDVCIYNDEAAEDAARLIAPTLQWQDNAAGSLTFTMPEVNAGYSTLQMLSTKIRVFRNGTEIWEGRPIKETKDFWKNRAITCEGALGYLNDTIQPQRMMPDDGEYKTFGATPIEFLRIILNYHNTVMRQNGITDRYFDVGTVTVTDQMKNEDDDDEYFDIPTIYTDYKSTLELISEKLISGKNAKGDDLEGHLRLTKATNGHFIIDYLKEPIATSDQIIEFGKNLLDFTVDYDETDYCTVVMAHGASDGESEVSEKLNNYYEINPELNGVHTKGDMRFQVTSPNVMFTQFYSDGAWHNQPNGFIHKVIEFSDCQDENELLDKTLDWFVKNRFADMELKLTAYDMAYLGVDPNFIEFMQNVRVISLPHGLDKLFPVLEVNIPLDKPESATYTLGKKKVLSLSTYSSNVDKDIKGVEIYAEQKSSSALRKALEESGDMIRSATTGKVSIIPTTGENGTAEFLVVANFSDDQIKKFISGELDIRKATNPMWAWSMGGLGYFPQGLASSPNVAMDMLGRINASMITTGKLTAIEINNGNGTFKVSADGKMECSSAKITGGDININDKFKVSNTGNLTSSGSATFGGAISSTGPASFGGTLTSSKKAEFTGEVVINNYDSDDSAWILFGDSKNSSSYIRSRDAYLGRGLELSYYDERTRERYEIELGYAVGGMVVRKGSEVVFSTNNISDYIRVDDGTSLQEFYEFVIDYIWNHQ